MFYSWKELYKKEGNNYGAKSQRDKLHAELGLL